MKKIFSLMLVLLMFVSLSACSSSDDTGSTGGDSTIKIGTIGPLEGDYSVYGIAVRNGADMAIKDYNEAHGTSYTLVAYDSKGDSTEAVNAYNKLVDEDEITALVGATLSGESIAVASASQGIGTPIISPSATAADFTLVGSNVFRGCYTDPFQAQVVAEFAHDTLGAATAAILYETGSDYSKGLTDTFTKTFEGLGGSVVITEGYNTGDVDFNTQLTKIQAAGADVLFVPNYYKDDALISKQAKALNITSTIVGGDGWDGVLSSVDNAADVEGAIFVNHYSPDNATIIELTDRYKSTYGVDANAFAVLSYDSTTMLLEVIDEVGTDADAIIAGIAAKKYDGVLGHMEFDANGDPIKDLSYITIKDGAYVTYTK